MEHLAAICFEGRSEIMTVPAAELRHEPIGAARWDFSQPEVIDTVFAPTADNVVTLAELSQEQRNVSLVVLEVPIHGDDILASAMREPSGQGRSLSEVATQLHDRDMRIDERKFLQQLVAQIRTAIINKYELIGSACALHDRMQLVVELGDVIFLVMERNNDGNHRSV